MSAWQRKHLQALLNGNAHWATCQSPENLREAAVTLAQPCMSALHDMLLKALLLLTSE